MKKVKCNLTPATPGASMSQGPPENQAVNPIHASLELQYKELEVDHAMVDALCKLVGVVRWAGSGSPLCLAVGGIPSWVEGVSQVEVSMPRVEVGKEKEKEEEVVAAAGGDGVGRSVGAGPNKCNIENKGKERRNKSG